MDSISSYIEYVVNQIEKLKEHTRIIRNNDISPSAINKALAEYTSVNLALNMEYQRIKWEYDNLLEEFNIWWDGVFIESKNKLNPVTLAGNKWASIKEIESYTRYENKEKYNNWREKLKELEHKVSFFQRLLDSWKSHKDVIINLSSNLRVELKSLHIDNNFEESKEEIVNNLTNKRNPV